MSRVSVLFDLQQTDSKIDSHLNSIATLEKSLADTSSVDAVRQATTEAEASLVTARTSLRELEADASQQEAHANELEKKLYGGQVKGQKEMVAAQHEIETFRQRKKETDDRSVEAMVTLETAEAGFKAAKARQATVEAERERAVEGYREEIKRLQAELEAARAEREKRLKMVMPPDVPVYEKLRQQKQGVAVSEVIQGKLCSKCRVELPMAKQRDIKGGNTIVNCPSCGRILFHKF